MGQVITISGDLGSGKTSVAKALADELGYQYLSTGRIHRDIAEELGMDALELSLHAELNPEIDRRIDSVLVGLAANDANYIVDSRVAWHFVIGSLKIYLRVDPYVAAERVVSDRNRINEPIYRSIQEAKNQLLARRESENRRFLAQYGIDCSDLRNYNLVVDSTLVTPHQVVQKLQSRIAHWQSGEVIGEYWVSPKLLFPTEHVRRLAAITGSKSDILIDDDGLLGNPIEVIVSDDCYFIWNGHRRTSAALLKGLALVPVSVLARNQEKLPTGETAEEFARAAINMSWLYDWEDAHGFRFFKYPLDSIALRNV